MMLAIKNNSARVYILKGRGTDGLVTKITIKPLTNPKGYQSVDSKSWDLVKNQNTVRDAVDKGQLVVKPIGDITGDDEVTKAEIESKPIAGGVQAKGFDAVASEVSTALQDGNIDEIRTKYPNLANMIDGLVVAAVAEATKKDDPPLAENVDALIESLGNDVESDVLKNSLREFALKKYELELHHNSGVDKLIAAIKEKEAELADGD